MAVVVASLMATVIGVGAGIFVTRLADISLERPRDRFGSVSLGCGGGNARPAIRVLIEAASKPRKRFGRSELCQRNCPLLPARNERQSEMLLVKRLMRLTGPILTEMDRMNFSLIAAGIGLFAMLALFPALATIVMLWSLIANPEDAYSLLALGQGVLPPDVQTLMSDQIARVITAGSEQGFGWALLLTLLVSIWSARTGVAAIMRGLNAVNNAQPRPSWIAETCVSLGLTVVLSGLALVAMLAMVIAPIIVSIVPLGSGAVLAIEIVRWLLATSVAILAFGAIFRYGPNLAEPKPGWITPGSLVAVVLWLLVSAAFAVYLARFGNYSRIYGSIGAAVALLIWFYLSAYVVLLGGTLNAELVRRGLLGNRQIAARPEVSDDAQRPRDPAQTATSAST